VGGDGAPEADEGGEITSRGRQVERGDGFWVKATGTSGAKL